MDKKNDKKYLEEMIENREETLQLSEVPGQEPEEWNINETSVGERVTKDEHTQTE